MTRPSATLADLCTHRSPRPAVPRARARRQFRQPVRHHREGRRDRQGRQTFTPRAVQAGEYGEERGFSGPAPSDLTDSAAHVAKDEAP
ncbi:hypothetical protein [Streptomyces sp. 2131.1]|uniref:hypothetical protein n=1 Tax=Streptomyces sp. 2131.1 TaxID=1855346 RepID=UPI00115FBCD2|nr:hypothetical protein [Streptomyces sp. 2131.1]